MVEWTMEMSMMKIQFLFADETCQKPWLQKKKEKKAYLQ